MCRMDGLLRLYLALALILLAPLGETSLAAGQRFQRGDPNGDDRLNLSDAVHTLGFLFFGNPVTVTCLDAADSNDDGKIDISDALALLGYLFRGSPAPPPPFAQCGEDPTPDALGCAGFAPCMPAERPDLLFPSPGYPTGAHPLSIAGGDLDGDGDLDLATANGAADTVSVLRNRSDGTFEAHVEYGVEIGPCSVVLRDLDRDGDLDLAVATYNSDSIVVLSNHGKGSFDTQIAYPVGHNPRFLCSGDLDGDGSEDLVTANIGSASVSVLRNRGDGNFEAQAQYGVGEDPCSVAMADLNGDGDPDLAVVNDCHGGSILGAVSVLRNHGDGTFETHVEYSVKSYPVSVALGDLDANGDIDMVVADRDNNSVSVLRNQGTGSFEAGINYYAGEGPTFVVVEDLDGDADADLAVANGSSDWSFPDSVSVLRGSGDGKFVTQRSFRAGFGPISIAVGDFDADADKDLAVANVGSTVTVQHNQGDGTFEVFPKYDVKGMYAASIAPGDLDGDGDLDLAVAARGCPEDYGSASILKGSGLGTFGAPINYGADICPTSIALGDLDGDEDLDLVLDEGSPVRAVHVLRNNAVGIFDAQVRYGVGSDPSSMVLEDLDGDESIDLIVANNGSDSVSVLRNQGDGSFEPQIVYVVGEDPRSVAASDLDGDGDMDLAVANYYSDLSSGTVSVLRNHDDGTFETHVEYPVGPFPVSVALGDLDGDGDVDIAVANSDWKSVLGTISILRNRGHGTFETQVTYSVGEQPISLALGDLDGDEDLDLAVANRFSDTVSVLRNQGDATFEPQFPFGVDVLPSSVALGDLDGDGDVDIATATDESGTVSVLLNQSVR